MNPELVTLGAEVVEELRADALRWRYVRDRLQLGCVPLYNGAFFYQFNAAGSDAFVTEVIDKLIAAERYGEADA